MVLALLACSQTPSAEASPPGAKSKRPAQAAPASRPATALDKDAPAPMPEVPAGHQIATFATGCFWCTESDFEKVPGVVSVTSGYTGGKVERPSYRQIGFGGTGHTEAVLIVFDPTKVTYERLLEIFWHTHDPTSGDGQFCDRGDQYRPEIFWHDDAQREAAEKSKEKVIATKPFKAPVVTRITKAGRFWTAENYHQDFYKKSSSHYQRYRLGCGRDARVKELWGELADKH
jgi:peptide-methionine (S)-S-oxide reductase